MKATYLVGCAVAALLAGGAGASAQDAMGQQPAVNPGQGAVATAPDGGTAGALGAPPVGPSTTEGPPSAASAAPADATGVGEVVVTAQRRRENLEKVPGTIQALTGQSLANLNATTFEDLIKYTPNVTFGNNGPGQGAIFMRGLSSGFLGGQSSATIASFPNVALYLDDQSMQFPGRNVDVYAVDLDRIEVLEGPQGTLFGGGAEAGAIRYITNKPKLNKYEGDAEAAYGFTSGGGENAFGHATLNIPLIEDKFAVRAVIYDDRHGGYIENVQSNFTRSNQDTGNYYLGIKPTNGVCPNRLPPGPNGCTIGNQVVANNSSLAGSDTNPLEYKGARFEALYKFNDQWDVLLTESLQNMESDGAFYTYPTGSDFQPLGALQVTSFEPAYDHDTFENTSVTVNGKIGDLSAIYTGAFMTRNISNQEDYTNYSRTGEGIYYACTGGNAGLLGSPGANGPFKTGTPLTCYSPLSYWRDKVRNTHWSNEARLSTPDDWRLRGLVGLYYEEFRIHDDMNFDYKTIPSCTDANLATSLAGGAPCVANVRTAPNSTANDPGVRGDMTAFGEDTQRGYDQTAVFASLDFDIIPRVLTVSGGTRYFDYNEFEVGSQYGTGSGCVDVPNGDCVGGLVNINNNHDKVTYTGFKSRAVLTWHPEANTTVYYLFSQGFRPGAFNRSSSGVAKGPDGTPQYEKPNGYAPDSLTNNEIGLKTTLFDRRLQVNISGYYMNWDNVQFGFYNPTELGNTTFLTNGPDYDIKGAEVQFIGRVTPQLTLQGSTSYNNATQSSSPCLVGNIPGNAAFGKCITQVQQSGVGLVSFQNPFGALGTTPAFSPEWEANLRARYDFNIYEYKMHAQLAGTYIDQMYNQPATYLSGAGVSIPNTTQLRYLQPAYVTADASVGVNYGRYYAELFASNLLDSHASTFTSSAEFIKSEVPLRPRVVMLKIGASF